MTAHPAAAFAIPGDIRSLTGGYIYERRLLEALRDLGHDVAHVVLPASFPDPSPADMAQAVATLISLGEARPLILDGLVFGAIDTAGLARVTAPIIAMIHHPLALESGLEPARRAHLFLTERDNLHLARHVLVPSPHTRQILIQRYGVAPERIEILPPGVDRPRLPPMPDNPPLILSVGILHPRKGHDVLVAALAQIGDLDWRAEIVGTPWDAACAADLARQVRHSPVCPRIRLAGRVAQKRLEQLYARATIFALATRYEGYGIVFDEALVRGLPIVTCDVGAVPDTVPKGAGVLVPPDDPEALAGALRLLLSQPETRGQMAEAALAAGRLLPDWRQSAQIASKLLCQLAPNSGG